MSQRFIRCPECGFPHDEAQLVCPITGLTIRRQSPSSLPPASPPESPRGKTPLPVPPRPPRAPRARPSTASLGKGRRVEAPPSSEPLPGLQGSVLSGQYRVGARLGQGGMGVVYDAEQVAMGRAVAIKVLHPRQAGQKVAVQRFQKEARAAALIGHPNICKVYDLGTLDDGSPYLVMEKLTGSTLADRIAAEGALPFSDVLTVMNQVLSGLVAAHAKGIVHRDIKPENVFLSRPRGGNMVVKILDFGVSKVVRTPFDEEAPQPDGVELTRAGMVMGTPFYMAPEQMRGERDLDARVDVWACGVVLYEALTGKRPFDAPNYNALLVRILSSFPTAARSLRPALPEGFDAVLDCAMAKVREDRFAGAAEFLGALRALRQTVLREAAALEAALVPSQRNPDLPLTRAPSSVEIPILLSGFPPPAEASDGIFEVDLDILNELPAPTEPALRHFEEVDEIDVVDEDEATVRVRRGDLPDFTRAR